MQESGARLGGQKLAVNTVFRGRSRELKREAVTARGACLLRWLAVLRYLMDDRRMNASDLGRLLGDRSLGPKILNGDRDLSKAHIRTLARHFHVSPAVLLD